MERQIIDTYVATGQARFEYHHYIVIDQNVGGTESRDAAEASECANEQGEFWNYHTILFANWAGEHEGAFTVRRLKAFADSIGLDTGKFNSCFDSGRYAAAVREDEQLARAMGVSRTPTIFVNNQQVQNPLDFSEFQRLIDAALGQ